MRRGVTLLELLTVVVIAGMLAASLATSFSAAVRYRSQTVPAREAQLQQTAFEDRFVNLLSRAFVDEDQSSEHTYFIGRIDPGGNDGGDAGSGSTELIFTVVGGPVSASAAAQTEADFEARNELIGPVGGTTETRLALTPIGEAGDAGGLFLREQTPADSDPDQGGFESVLDSRVVSVSFEFFDGVDWIAEWDTRTAERRLPSAVRVNYVFDGEDAVRQLIVPLRNSDVTAAVPANATATEGGSP